MTEIVSPPPLQILEFKSGRVTGSRPYIPSHQMNWTRPDPAVNHPTLKFTRISLSELSISKRIDPITGASQNDHGRLNNNRDGAPPNRSNQLGNAHRYPYRPNILGFNNGQGMGNGNMLMDQNRDNAASGSPSDSFSSDSSN